MAEQFANKVRTTLNGAIGSGQTTITVNSVAGIPTLGTFRIFVPAEGNNTDEIMTVTAVAGNQFLVTRASEAIGGVQVASAHSDGAPVIIVATAGALQTLAPKDRIWTPPGLESISDEFDNGSIDPAWTRVELNTDYANVGWTEAANVMSVKNTGTDAGARFHALMRSLNGMTYPITIETASRHYSQYAVNYFMLGIGFADGITYGTGKQITTRPYTYSSIATALRLSVDSLTGYNTEVGTGDWGNVQIMGGPFYHRLIWSAANTFQVWFSPDGVSWHQTNSNYSYTITPTYFGMFSSNWGTTQTTIGTFEYIRVYNSNKGGSA